MDEGKRPDIPEQQATVWPPAPIVPDPLPSVNPQLELLATINRRFGFSILLCVIGCIVSLFCSDVFHFPLGLDVVKTLSAGIALGFSVAAIHQGCKGIQLALRAGRLGLLIQGSLLVVLTCFFVCSFCWIEIR